MVRIALASLFHDRGRLVAALAGVTLATLLLLVQAGIYFGFRHSASMLIERVGGEVWLTASSTESLNGAELLGQGSAAVARAHPCVQRVRPLVVSWIPYLRGDSSSDTLQLVGYEPHGPTLLPWNFARGLPTDLEGPDRCSVDVSELQHLRLKGDPLGQSLELAGHSFRIAALTHGIRSMVLVPIVFTEISHAREALGLGADQASAWVLDVSPRSCIPSVLGSVAQRQDLRAWTRQDFAHSAEEELVVNSGVGVILAFVALLGFLVAVAIVGQTLFSITNEHRKELATLKAIGANTQELIQFVLWQALALAFVGGALGMGLSLLLRNALIGAIPIVLSPVALAMGAVAVLVMCAVASARSVASVLRLEAAAVLE